MVTDSHNSPLPPAPAAAAIIVPHHNDEARLRLLLDSITRQLPAAQLAWTVFVVDDASAAPDVAAGICRESGVRFLTGTGQGSYSARNLGIAAAGNVAGFVFTDSDCIWEPGAVAAYEAWLLGPDPRVLAAGPITLFAQNPAAPNRWEFLDMATGLLQENKVKQEQVAVTANLAVRRAGFARFGVFNQHHRSGGDIEFTRRVAQAAGGIAWLDDARILHPARASREEHLAKMRRVQGGTIERERRTDGRLPATAALGHFINAIRPPVHAWKLILRSRRGGWRDKFGAGWAALEQRAARASFVLGALRPQRKPVPAKQPPLAGDRVTLT